MAKPKHNGRVTYPPCQGSEASGHSPTPWTRLSEAEERDLAVAFLAVYVKQVEDGEPLETERPHPFVPSQTERHAQFTETGRMPFWTRHCLACDQWAQSTPHDPGLGPLHPHADLVR